jgi:hypothetical protein
MIKKIVAIVLIIIGTFIVYRAVRHFINRPQKVTVVTQTIKLPENWQKVATPAGASQKYAKTVTSGFQPEVVLIVSTSVQASDSAKYTNLLIAGAKSDLPTLKFLTDETKTTSSLYSRFLSGYYYNQKTKVDLLQRIYIQGNTVSILTASFDAKSASADEINSIFDSIWLQHPAN